MADKKEVLRLMDLAYQARQNLCKMCCSYSGNVHMGGDMSYDGSAYNTVPSYNECQSRTSGRSGKGQIYSFKRSWSCLHVYCDGIERIF